jgi:hypothetical protein
MIGQRLELLRLAVHLLDLALGQQDRVNVRQYTALRNCDVSEKLAEFFVVSNSKLYVTGDNAGLLVVACCIASKFEHLKETAIFQIPICRVTQLGLNISTGTKYRPMLTMPKYALHKYL